jgi:enamine deaminase RidA (YjgF/YER057c/UK114 family)
VTDAGFSLADTVRVTIIVTDVAFADRVFPVLGQYFGEIRPAMTMIVAGLVKPEMKIEIELTAMKG